MTTYDLLDLKCPLTKCPLTFTRDPDGMYLSCHVADSHDTAFLDCELHGELICQRARGVITMGSEKPVMEILKDFSALFDANGKVAQ